MNGNISDNDWPLVHAINDNDLEKIKALVARGAVVNTDGLTPLWLAVANNTSVDIVDFLIEEGADMTVKVDGRTPLEYAIEKKKTSKVIEALKQGRKPKPPTVERNEDGDGWSLP